MSVLVSMQTQALSIGCGHMMLFDEENGYSPEYIYGNYFERAPSLGERK
ncbi:hypothetical protein AMTRI_Chr10g231830 [Amborella trichopoda]